MDEEYEFEVWQGGAWQAGGTAPSLSDALREARHYQMMYEQDAPVTLKFYARREIPIEQIEAEEPASAS